MKQVPVILVVLLIALSVFAAFRITSAYVESHQAAWQVESSAKAVMNLKDYDDQLRNDAQRRAWFTQFYQVLFTFLLLVAGLSVSVYSWLVYDQRKESWARAVDGTFALQAFSNGQVRWQIDPNKIHSGTTGFQKATGALGEFTSAAGPDRQLAYNLSIQRTRTASATAISEIRNSAQAKYASGFYDRPQRLDDYRVVEDEVEQLPMLPFAPLSLTDAFQQSTADRWLLGQNDTGACAFDITSTVHTGLLGATKTGKTESTALLMAMNARRNGMQVIAFDGAGGIDWQPYNNVFEVYETDYMVIGDQIDRLIQLDRGRMKALQLAGKPNIDALDYFVPSLFVILEEFGKTMQSFRAYNKKLYEATETALGILMKTSRKTGIYFLLIDQSMSGWPQLIKPNIKDYISYHLGGNQGAAFNAYDLHKLRQKGQFWNNGNVYDAWHTKAEADSLIKQLPQRRVSMLVDSTATKGAVTSFTSNEGEGEVNGKKEAYPPPQSFTSKSDNTRVTTDKTGDNEGDKTDNFTSNVTSGFTIAGAAVTTQEKQEVYRIYQALGKRKNATAKAIWGNAGGYLRYLNAVIAEYEGGETLQ